MGVFEFSVFSARSNEHVLPKCRIIVYLCLLKFCFSKRAKEKIAWRSRRKNGIFLRDYWKDREGQVQMKS